MTTGTPMLTRFTPAQTTDAGSLIYEGGWPYSRDKDSVSALEWSDSTVNWAQYFLDL